MSQSVNFGNLWSCVGSGLNVHELGGDYSLLDHIDTTDPAPLRPISAWKTSEAQYVLAIGRHNWDMIEYAPEGLSIHASMESDEGTFLGGWVDFKSQTLYAVEKVDDARNLTVWTLGRSPQYRTTLHLGEDVGSGGGQIVLGGRLNGDRHIVVLMGPTKVALVNIATSYSPKLTSIVADGGVGIAVRSKHLYIQAGVDTDHWIASYDITDPVSPDPGSICRISGLWGDGPDMAAQWYGGKNLILSHDVRVGGEEEWMTVYVDKGDSIALLNEHRIPSQHGDVAIDTVDIVGNKAYFWGYAPGYFDQSQQKLVVPYYVAELNLDDTSIPPVITLLSIE